MAEENPLLLLIETSGQIGRVGLARGPQLLAERALDETRRHARDLVPMTASLFGACSCGPRDLAGVIVSLGPGSYTGLRVGIMSAKTLAYATGCAVIGIPTFHILAAQAETTALELDAIADAQKGKLYLQSFRRPAAAEPFGPANELHIVEGQDWARQCRPDVFVTGPGLKLAESWLSTGAAFAPHTARDATVAGLLAVGWEWYERGVRDDPLRLEPLYLRSSSAEEQWDRRADRGLSGSAPSS